MKQRRKKRKSCRGKVKHKSRDFAIIAIKKMEKMGFSFRMKKPYKCKYCGYWHVGRTNKILYERFDKLKQ